MICSFPLNNSLNELFNNLKQIMLILTSLFSTILHQNETHLSYIIFLKIRLIYLNWKINKHIGDKYYAIEIKFRLRILTKVFFNALKYSYLR